MGSFYIKQCTAQIKLSGNFMDNLALDFDVFEDVFLRRVISNRILM